MTTPAAPAKWDTFRMGSLLDVGERPEVFVSPEGKWYIRCEPKEEADLVVPLKTPGLSPLRLKCIDHWKPTEGLAQS